MPFGCFEQTSSATYPNVLALDYMKRTKKLTPEVHAKAEGFTPSASSWQGVISAPGRSPGTARARRLRLPPPAGAASCSTLTTPHDSALDRAGRNGYIFSRN